MAEEQNFDVELNQLIDESTWLDPAIIEAAFSPGGQVPRNLQRKLQQLWQVIDQLHTAAQDVGLGLSSTDTLAAYVLLKTQEAMQTVPYPGEPPETPEVETE